MVQARPTLGDRVLVTAIIPDTAHMDTVSTPMPASPWSCYL